MKILNIVNKKFLVKYWVFFCHSNQSFCKVNHFFFHFSCYRFVVVNFNLLFFALKNIISFLFSLQQATSAFLFVSSHFFYNFSFSLQQFSNDSSGLFSKLCISNISKSLLTLDLIPAGMFFFNSRLDILSFLIAKNKQVPSFGFVENDVNSMLVDYPISISCRYFFIHYFFILYFFKLFKL